MTVKVAVVVFSKGAVFGHFSREKPLAKGTLARMPTLAFFG